ncbi:MAG: hypothetical protein ACXADX_15450 [Candidatus Hodarchaeales archaeon]
MTLFDRGMIGNLEIPNRFVRSATGENAANKNGTITDEFLPMNSALAKGLAAVLIIPIEIWLAFAILDRQRFPMTSPVTI